MKAVHLLLCLLVTVMAVRTAAAVATRDAKDCAELGFHKSQLQCSLCDALFQRTGSAELNEECLSCCTAASSDGSTAFVESRYTSARIDFRTEEQLRSTTAHQSELHTFVQTYLDKAPYKSQLHFRGVFSSYSPQLVLVTEDGEEVQVRIGSWKAFQLDEFLLKKLAKPSE